MSTGSKRLRGEIVQWGARAFERRLVSGWGGNISCRLGKERYLITRQHAALGFLKNEDIVEIDTQGRSKNPGEHPSSETKLHLAVYGATDAGAIVHVHPPAVIAYSMGGQPFVPGSFEEKYTVGEVPVIPQDTPTVTEPACVVEALKLHPVVILQRHGTVAYGKDLMEAFLVTDLLEEAVQCHFWRRDVKDVPPGETARAVRPRADGGGCALFSREHIEAMRKVVNDDDVFQSLGRDKHLTTSLTMALEDEGLQWTFHFNEGTIASTDGERGEFVISGSREWWEAVFQKNFDPFLATQQGKLKLVHGEIWRLAQWFKPFQRGFELWQAIPTKQASSPVRG